MKTVHVSATRQYDVMIERGLLDRAGELSTAVAKGRKAAVIAGDIVFPLYGERLVSSLKNAGFEVFCHIIPHGEHTKDLKHYEELLSFLSENHFSRSDTVFALGGGVTGDLSGFAAATYQRGMSFIQVPTTLLAAVDSSVGGKTAVNLPGGKNQVGCFYQPSLVICDPDLLSSLPEEQFKCGCAEVIKYGALGDRAFFDSLMQIHISRQPEAVIARCVEMKRDVVAEDEFDTGKRQLLNFGHTFAHCVEALSDFTVLHGQAVAIGMSVITRAAAELGYCSKADEVLMEDILQMYGLPSHTEYRAADMLRVVLADKKRSGGSINLVLPRAIGDCRIVPTPVTELEKWLRAGGVR